MTRSCLALTCCLATLALADVPVREGANHHLGDDSFVARFGRLPSPIDDEALRMHVHLEYVRAWLASRPPTRPELATRRAELLGYLDEYIAAGVTPQNTSVPWRNPVFIDAAGRICAVGYLIERSVGRALPERIAAAHRLDYLEDIASAMPEVAAWAGASGFTLEELASIQPGYLGPDAQNLTGWVPEDMEKLPDGPVHEQTDVLVVDGTFEHRHMTGTWTVKTTTGVVVGSGTFRRGAGFWTSLRLDGSKLAAGPFVRDHAEGEWRFYHPSGRLAAIGPMREGHREGRWTFFYDAEPRRPISTGRFEKGQVVDTWQHYGQEGELVATASGRPWGQGLVLRIAEHDGVRREIVQGEPASTLSVEGVFKGRDTLYILDRDVMVDARGNKLERSSAGWRATSLCWDARRRAAAAKGNVQALFLAEVPRGGPVEEPAECTAKPVAVEPALAARYEALLAARQRVHTKVPSLVFDDLGRAVAKPDATEAPPADEATADPEPPPNVPPATPDDMANYLADGMRWYMEWGHVDGQFDAVYATLPGYLKPPQ